MGPHSAPGLTAPGLPARLATTAALALGAAAVALLPIRFCLAATVLHIPCPGCGMTRATLALLRGDWGAALSLHPLSIVVAPFGAALAVQHIVRYVATGRASLRLSRWQEGLLVALSGLLLAVWILRFCGWFGGPVRV